MAKYSFLDDYSEGCHPEILDAMQSTNMAQQTAYGDDEYSLRARQLIQQYVDDDDIPVFFVAGGTLANIIIIASALRPHEAIIAAATGHIVVRETGAIEATGHKIISVPSLDGKLTVESIESALAANSHYPHMAKPRMVYISNATEAGTVYSRTELSVLSSYCKLQGLLLLLDGARLGAALSADHNDLTLKSVAELTDIFWIGGTKAGALLGEAIVVPNAELARDFSFHIKQRGGLLAKGRLLGLQFTTLFETGLFFKNSRHANTLAQKLSMAITSNGYKLAADTESNQIFPVLPVALINKLQDHFNFYVWEKLSEQECVVRLVTSWATDEDQVDAFTRMIKA